MLRDELKRWQVKVDVGYGGIRLVRDPDRGPVREEPDTDDLLEWTARRVAGAGGRRLVVMIDEVSVLVGTLEEQEEGRGAGPVARAILDLAADHHLSVVPGHLPPAYGFSSDLLRRAWRVLRHLP